MDLKEMTELNKFQRDLAFVRDRDVICPMNRGKEDKTRGRDKISGMCLVSITVDHVIGSMLYNCNEADSSCKKWKMIKVER